MRLTQERIVEILELAIEYQNNLIQIQKHTESEIAHLISSSKDEQAKEALRNFGTQILFLTKLNMETVVKLAQERAHFNPARMSHNRYMRSIKQRYNIRKKLQNNPLDLPLNDELPRQNNEHPTPRQNNVANEVPLLANIEAEEKRLGLNSDEDELKQKFGPDFQPLPVRVGLKRH